MHMLLILFLFLTGCNVDDSMFPPLKKRKQEGEPLVHVEPKYKTPNEFTLKSGCKVRVRTWFQARGKRIVYPLSVPLNDWTEDCSEAPDMIEESDVVNARYK